MERLAGLFRAMLGNVLPTKHPDQIRSAEHDDPHRGDERDGEQQRVKRHCALTVPSAWTTRRRPVIADCTSSSGASFGVPTGG